MLFQFITLTCSIICTFCRFFSVWFRITLDTINEIFLRLFYFIFINGFKWDLGRGKITDHYWIESEKRRRDMNSQSIFGSVWTRKKNLAGTKLKILMVFWFFWTRIESGVVHFTFHLVSLFFLLYYQKLFKNRNSLFFASFVYKDGVQTIISLSMCEVV